MFSNYQQKRDWDNLQTAIDEADEIPPCTNDPELFYPEAGGEIAVLRKLCGGCPVVQECGEYGVKWEFHGIWGGLTARERIVMRRGLGIKSNPLTRERVAESFESSVDPFFDSYFAEPVELTDLFER